jgi:hypothetical protein
MNVEIENHSRNNGDSQMNEIFVQINGTRYRLMRDGLECEIDGVWNGFSDDELDEPSPILVAAFEALEKLELALNDYKF